MMRSSYDVIVVGGGPAGLAAALSAKENGAASVLLVERDGELGGILNQCIHNGFGLQYFQKELTGPEYAKRFMDLVERADIDVLLDTMVLSVTRSREVETLSPAHGAKTYRAGALILAMGCRERTRGAVGIPGDRPAGVLTAGTAQRMMNIEGWQIGKRVIVLGSGDIGLIMARRMTLEGAKVEACVEVMPYSGGLRRNIVQCLDDFGIPLLLSHTVTKIHGRDRVEKVTIARVNAKREPVPGSERDIECDTVLLSVGLIPENELSRAAGIEMDPATGGPVVDEHMQTSVPGIYSCGNAVHVHDLVDFVTLESQRAGAAAVKGTAEGAHETGIRVFAGDGVSSVVPQRICASGEPVEAAFRVREIFRDGVIRVLSGGREMNSWRKSFMAPGEMEKIRLDADILEQARGESLTIAVEGV